MAEHARELVAGEEPRARHGGYPVLEVIESLAQQRRDLTLAEVVDRVGLSTSTAHRLLSTLLQHQMVERDPLTRRYRLGLRFLEMGSTSIHQRGFRPHASVVLERLASFSGETAHLAVLAGADTVCVYKVDGPSATAMSSRVGAHLPCHCTSTGKVLVAWGGERLLRMVVDVGLAAHTSRTITDRVLFRRELRLVRRKGYALDLEEFEEGLRCVAAPVIDESGAVAAAIGLAGPRGRLSDSQLRRLSGLVRTAAAEIAEELRSGRTAPPWANWGSTELQRSGRV